MYCIYYASVSQFPCWCIHIGEYPWFAVGRGGHELVGSHEILYTSAMWCSRVLRVTTAACPPCANEVE